MCYRYVLSSFWEIWGTKATDFQTRLGHLLHINMKVTGKIKKKIFGNYKMSHILNTVLQKCWKFNSLSRKHWGFTVLALKIVYLFYLIIILGRYCFAYWGWSFRLSFLFIFWGCLGFFLNKFSQTIVHLLDTLNFWAKNNPKHGLASLSLLLITPYLSSNTDSFRHFALKWPIPVLSQETTWTGFPNKCKTHRNYVNVAQLFIQSNM